MPSHTAPTHGLPEKHRWHLAPSLPFSLKKTALLTALMLTAGLLSGTSGATTINNGNLTSTFGNGSANLDLENNGTITVSGNGMAAGNNSTLQNNGAITSNGYRAYGMTATSGSDLTNGKTGTITMNQPYGYGMAISGTSGTLTNDGAITLNNISTAGLYAANSGTSPATISVTNNGTITGKGRDNVGISASGSGITVTNNGTLNMQGSNNGGIVVNGAGNTVANTGQINISGTSGKGAEIFGTGTTFTNTGTFSVSGTYGTAIEAGPQTTIYQNGTLNITSTSGTGVMLESGATLYNTGTITTTQDYSYPVLGYDDNITVTNSGTISTAGTETAAIALSGNNSRITNTGTLTTSGEAAYGISISGDGSSVTNNGSIITTGENAHGILVTGQNITIASTGKISATGAGSHELAIGSADGSTTGSATLTAWSVTLSPNQWTNADSRPIAVGPGSTLNFANTRLILRPGSTASGFAFNQRYNVADMIDNDGTITGGISSDTPDAAIAGAMPMLKAQLYGSSASGAGNQQVSLSIEPEDNHGQGANSAAVHRAAARMWLLNRTLGNALDALVAASDWTFFIQPYYQHSRVTGSASSRADSEGLILGATGKITDKLTLGWHAGLEHTDTTVSGHGLKSDANAWMAGLHGRYSIMPGWHLQGQTSATVSRSDYRFAMEGDSSDDERTEYGLFASLKSIWDIALTERQTLSPEIGLAWAWMRNPAMDANWRQPGNQDMNLHFEKRDFTAVYGTADLRWKGNFTHAGNTYLPTFAVGVRQNLADGHVDSGFTFMDKHYTANLTEDRTSGIVDAGLRITRGNLSGALRYNGEFGSHYTDHIIWAEIGSTF